VCVVVCVAVCVVESLSYLQIYEKQTLLCQLSLLLFDLLIERVVLKAKDTSLLAVLHHHLQQTHVM